MIFDRYSCFDIFVKGIFKFFYLQERERREGGRETGGESLSYVRNAKNLQIP